MGIPVVLVHGGAGNIGDERVCDTIDGVRKAVVRGYDILAKGGTSLDAAQACVEVMEEDPIFNAGTLVVSKVVCWSTLSFEPTTDAFLQVVVPF